MAAPFRSLTEDYPRYLKSFELFVERSSEHQCMLDFIHNTLPDILASIGGGRPVLNVLGVGSGTGEIDLQMLAQLHLKHPHATVLNEVVEPSDDMLHKYKVRVLNTPGLDHINFAWKKMTASEFEKHWLENSPGKEMDFIHLIEMLYYVKDPVATISFFRSLLNKDGKLMIVLVSGESGWGKLYTTFKEQLCYTEMSQRVTTGDLKTFLDSEGVPYRSYELLSQLDITECFSEGDPVGELLLDFLTEVKEFRKNAPEDERKRVLDQLRHPDCSKEVDGRVIFSYSLGVLVLEP